MSKLTKGVVVSMTILVALFAVNAMAVAPADYGLKEGDVISAAGSSDPDVYIVNEMGYKRLFLNPAIFGFYGHLGGFSAVKSVSPTTRDAFVTSGLFRNCETNDEKVYGVETTGEDVGMLHWVNTSGAQAVADDPNFFKKVFCINTNEFNWYPKGTAYTSVNQVPNYTRTGGTVNTGNVSVSLASDNPSSGTIVNGQARYELARFMFTGNGTVVSFKVKRIGVSADASLTNVYLYEGNKRLTDSVTVSSSEMNFNDTAGLFTVSGSKVVSVLADVSGTAGESVGVQAISLNGNAVSVSGNLHSIATATDADVTMNATTTPSSDGTPAPVNDFVAWQNSVTVGTRYVWLKSVQYRVVGSVMPGDLKNFRLFVDGVEKASVMSADANNYVVFDMTGSPVKLETGGRVLKVLVDIVNGSSRTFYLSMRQKADLWTIDSQYNSAVLASGTFPVNSTEQTIGSGELTVTKTTDSPSGDVVKGASGVTLAKFELKATGEKMKIENLRVNVNQTGYADVALRNGSLFVDGVQIGSTQTIWDEDNTNSSSSYGYAEFSLGSSLVVEPNVPRILEVRADIYDASGTDNITNTQTLTVSIDTGSSNVQRLTKLDYVSRPSADVDGNPVTVKTGSFTAGKYTGYANQSIVAPVTSPMKVGHYTLTAASSEDVNVNTLTFDFGSTASGTLTNDFTDSFVKVYTDAGTLLYTSPTKTALSPSASNSYSVNFTVPKNKVYQVELWSKIANTFYPDTQGQDIAVFNMNAAGTTAGSSTTANSGEGAGQTITSASGALTVANGSLPTARFVNGGTTSTVYSFTMTPAYDNYTLEEVYVDIATPGTAKNVGAVATLYLKEGSTTLASAVLNSSTGSASFTGLNYPLPQSGGTKTLTVDVQFADVGVGANDTAGSVTLRLDGMKYRNSAGTYNTATYNGWATTYTGNAHYDVKSYPSFANGTLPTSVLSAGTQTLFKTVVSANGAQVDWNDIRFAVSSNSAAISITGFKLYENGVDITANASTSAAITSDTGASTSVRFEFGTPRSITPGSPVTLELKATIGGTLGTTDVVTTKISNPKGSTVTAAAAETQHGVASTFTWSDLSAASHATTTSDWFNDGLLKTLGESQSLSK